MKRNRFWDYLANAIGLAGLSTPNFWLGIMLILLVSVDLGWLPPSGYVPLTEDWRQSLATTIMPAFVLGNAIAADPDAAHAQRNADGAGPGLRPHRARQGPGASSAWCSATRCATR